MTIVQEERRCQLALSGGSRDHLFHFVRIVIQRIAGADR